MAMLSLRHSWAPRTNDSWCTAFCRRLSFHRLVEDRSGATAIEYGLIAALVSVAGIAAFSLLGDSLNDLFDLVSSAVADSTHRCVEADSNCDK
jgi:pilus assembly protein Flp/PilA